MFWIYLNVYLDLSLSLSGASEPSRKFRCAEALGRASVFSSGKSEIKGHHGPALIRMLSQSGRDASQVCISSLFVFHLAHSEYLCPFIL